MTASTHTHTHTHTQTTFHFNISLIGFVSFHSTFLINHYDHIGRRMGFPTYCWNILKQTTHWHFHCTLPRPYNHSLSLGWPPIWLSCQTGKKTRASTRPDWVSGSCTCSGRHRYRASEPPRVVRGECCASSVTKRRSLGPRRDCGRLLPRRCSQRRLLGTS